MWCDLHDGHEIALFILLLHLLWFMLHSPERRRRSADSPIVYRPS